MCERPTALVTGARGVGYEVGRALAQAGFRLVFGMRSLDAGIRAADRIRAEVPDAEVSIEVLDLADLASIAAFGTRLTAQLDQLDVLVNNAGVVMPPERGVTADGFELHFGTNHLGHFALTGAVLPLLRASKAARVVVVGSLAHRHATIDFDDLQAKRSYRPSKAYGQSKLANLLFMTELQRRSDAGRWGLTSVGAHPGFARTEAILRPDDGRMKRAFIGATSRLIPSAESAARPVVHAATAAGVVPAGYYGPRGPAEIAGRPGPARLAPRAREAELAGRLWDVSETLTGIRY